MQVRQPIRRFLDLDPDRDVSLGETPRRMAMLAGLGVVLGVIGGLAAAAIVKLVGLVTNLALLHRVAFDLPDLQHFRPGPELLLVAVGGAVVVSLLARWAPTIRGHGIPESLEAIVDNDSRIPPRILLAKPVSAVIAMGTGGPFGAEGPIIVTGGSAGSLLGQAMKLSSAERRIALATGAAAGMAGVFATPIAAVVIAFELLLFERSLRALVPLLVATAVATQLHDVLLGPGPMFRAVGVHAAGGWQLPCFALLGVACGIAAVLLNKGLTGFETLYDRSGIPTFFHPLVGALGFAAIGLVVPGTLSVGYWAIEAAVNGQLLLGAAAVLLVAKAFSWWIALASNTSGGTLAPIFVIGSALGLLCGAGFQHAFPGLGIQPAAFAVVAMGAIFGAAARALLTGTVFALEVTGSFELVIPMFLATAVAELVTHRFLDQRLMTEKLLRRGNRIEFDTQVDPFRTTVAGRNVLPAPDGPLDPDLPRIESTAFLTAAVPPLLAAATTPVVVTAGGEPVGVLDPDAIGAALGRRHAEGELQPPTLLVHLRRIRPETGTDADQSNRAVHESATCEATVSRCSDTDAPIVTPTPRS